MEIITDIRPDKTPLIVMLYMKTMSKKEAWKKYREEMKKAYIGPEFI